MAKNLELKIHDEVGLNGWLNYWDTIEGLDLVADIREGKLYYGDNEITFKQFLEEIFKSDGD